MVDINTIGAGGGSIAWIDDRGVLRVGPESAGAQPGPICYDQGGEDPTVTDADLLLGYLNPDFFLGGEKVISRTKARNGIRDVLAEPLDLSTIEVAAGIYRVTNEQIINQIRQVSVQRGHDPRDFVLVAAGGAAPVHAADFASHFGTTVIIPGTAGTLSAFGLLRSDIRQDYVRSITEELSIDVLERMKDAYESMEAEATAALDTDGDNLIMKRSIESQYEGQVHDITISIESEDLKSPEEIERLHHRRHEELFTFHDQDSPIEIENVRLTAIKSTEKPDVSTKLGKNERLKEHRDVYFSREEGFVETPIYDGEPGHLLSFDGPGIVECPYTTIVVPPECKLETTRAGDYKLSNG